MTPNSPAILVLSLALNCTALAGEKFDENKDLDLIPQAARAAAAPEFPGAAVPPGKIYLVGAFTQSWLQSGLVPAPPPHPPAWEERALLDVRKEWHLRHDVGLAYSGRLNLRVQDGLGFPNHENVSNDLREAYASWEPVDRMFFDFGRINLKSGVALGFNPTDFFKTRTVVEPLSVDPVVLREDRLGALMLRAQRIWPGGSLTAAYAPAVASASPIYTDMNLRSFDPMLDRTNAQDRWLLKGSIDVAEGFNPEWLAYHDNGQTRWGANLAESVGASVVAYLEWSGGARGSLIGDALRYGRDTGTLPAAAAGVLPDPGTVAFRNEFAAGASFTTQLPKITFNAELNYNQAGFSGQDWENWFRAARGAGRMPPAAGALWYMRAYATDQQQPISRRFAFLRADWVDAFVPKLELIGFVDADLIDGSSRFQLSADYYLSDRWTAGCLLLINFGGAHSDFGSLAQAGGVQLKVVRYL